MPRIISFGNDTDHFNMKSNLIEYLLDIFFVRIAAKTILGMCHRSEPSWRQLLTFSVARSSVVKVEFYDVVAFMYKFYHKINVIIQDLIKKNRSKLGVRDFREELRGFN